MDGGGAPSRSTGGAPSRSTGGEFLLSLLQNSKQSQLTQPSFAMDPAVAAVGPAVSTNSRDLSSSPWSQQSSLFPPNFFLQGFPQNHMPPQSVNQFPGSSSRTSLSEDDNQRLGFHQKYRPDIMFGSIPSEFRNHEGLPDGIRANNSVQGRNIEDLMAQLEVSKVSELGFGYGTSAASVRNRQFESQANPSSNSHIWEQDRRGNVNYDSHQPNQKGSVNYGNRVQDQRGNGVWGRQEQELLHRYPNDGGYGRPEHGVVHRPLHNSGQSRHEQGVIHRSPQVTPRQPPGFPSNPPGGRNLDNENTRKNSEQNTSLKNGGFAGFNNRVVIEEDEHERIRRGSSDNYKPPGDAMQKSRPPAKYNFNSVKLTGIEESLLNFHDEHQSENISNEHGSYKQDEMEKAVDESNDNEDKKKGQKFRDKNVRSDTRGTWLLSQKMRGMKKQLTCRPDIDLLNAPFLAIFESLIPAEEEKAKQKQLLTLLERLVSKEWPQAQLYLYGSCANSFGVSKSDIDICLAIEDVEISKVDTLLRLADILQADKLQNVQALTRARVPIVKLMDPFTGISCDICMNNVLAVVNTKLLRDYAQIDTRLRQLAFIVKHWAKSRGVNATYQGTLSSYAYVLMCIHFLQQRQPAILPCLQGMEPTYSVTVEGVKCAYFDRVETLSGFGSNNTENIAQLVWAFFKYWAYGHDYANTAISVRTGSILSKRSKDWTTRVGNDRHLICIEDPFETSHDLGRVVDKFSIKVLREEFERAAHIMQYDPNPCVNLFEPYCP